MADLFPSWTWSLPKPAPFNDGSVPDRSTSSYSKYCTQTNPRSTLHGPTIQAILSYMDVDTSLYANVSGVSAIGLQGTDRSIVEYKSRDGGIHAVSFNRVDGRFSAAVFDDPQADPKLYQLSETDGQTGSALFFALIPFLMHDIEFNDHYTRLGNELQKSTPEMGIMLESVYVLCDNVYRRIKRTDLGDGNIDVSIPGNRKIARMSRQNIDDGMYSATSVIYGNFQILQPNLSAGRTRSVVSMKDWIGKYADPARTLTDEEKALIPSIPEDYVLPGEVEECVEFMDRSKSLPTPLINAMFRGPSGTGKTVGAQLVAAIFGRPFLVHGCDPDSDQNKFSGGYAPKTTASKTAGVYVELPTLEDIEMDPASAYYKMTGKYVPTVTELEVSKMLNSTLIERIKSLADTGQFEYVDTEFVKAVRNGYVVEIEEMSIIKNQAVPVGLNAILDDQIKSFVLPNGDVVHRHPDTIVIVTTNKKYVGCKPMNQSVLSRYHLKFDFQEPEKDDLIKRVSVNSGCKDLGVIRKMVRAIDLMQKKAISDGITDGVCGTREAINWATAYECNGDVKKAAKRTVLASITEDEENQNEIARHCLDAVF